MNQRLPTSIPKRPLAVESIARAVEPSYMQKFKCLGSECPDSCCKGWAVMLSKKDHRRLKVILGEEELDRVSFVLEKGRRPKEDWKPGHAAFQMSDAGDCSYLNEDGWCKLHSDFGEDALSNVCMQYPRYQTQFDDRIERVATLACPEVARLCLLESEAMDAVPFELEPGFALARPAIALRSASTPKLRHFDRVRELLFSVLQLGALPLSDRIAVLLVMAAETSDYLASRGNDSEEQALSRLDAVAQGSFQGELAANLQGVRPSGRAVQVLVSFNLSIYPCSYGGRIRSVVKGILEDYEARAGAQLFSSTGGFLSDDTTDTILALYEQRRDDVYAHHGPLIERYLTHYALNFVMREHYFDYTDLAAYVRELVLRLASLKFLLLSQPEFGDVWSLSETDLGGLAVDTFQRFAREIEHANTFSVKLSEMLENVKATDVGSLACVTRL